MAPIGAFLPAKLEETFRHCGLEVKGHKQLKSGEDMVYFIEAFGTPAGHERLMAHMVEDTAVKQFRY